MLFWVQVFHEETCFEVGAKAFFHFQDVLALVSVVGEVLLQGALYHFIPIYVIQVETGSALVVFVALNFPVWYWFLVNLRH